VFATLLLCAAPLRGQEVEPPPGDWRALRIAKWSMVGVSVGAALYGFSNNQRADDAFEELERMCQADVQRCAGRTASGAYADPVLESAFQEIRRLDRRARVGLVAGQAAVASAVVLFILDLRNDRPPPNIPYDGRMPRLEPARTGGLALVWRVGI
jgi:hypothetical protein